MCVMYKTASQFSPFHKFSCFKVNSYGYIHKMSHTQNTIQNGTNSFNVFRVITLSK